VPAVADLIAALTPAERAALDRLLGRAAFPMFGPWLAAARPQFRWDYRHFRRLQAVLDRVTAGDLRRVYFQCPIRHGKTEHNTIGYAAYRLERDPAERLLVCSYNSRRAEKFSREVRRLVAARGVPLSQKKDGAGEWETTAGGGVQAVGAGSGVASVNADLILVDDPIGSREDAESTATRERVWDWLTNDVLARCEPHTAVLLTMSRWHSDDPAGRLLDGRAGTWHVVDLPAEAEPGDPLGRPPGEPLWPELRGAVWLAEKRAELGAYGFASLLQGRPRPRSGGMFKWEWWGLVGDLPLAGPLVRYWDLAGTEGGGGTDPDWTVGALLGRRPDGRTVVCDVARFRHAVGRRDAEIEAVAKADAARYGGRARWWLERESGIGGADRTALLVRRIQAAGVPVTAEPATVNKVVRAEPLASACEAGNVLLGPGDWRDAVRAEAADFPTGKHDDVVDALSGAFNKLALGGDGAAPQTAAEADTVHGGLPADTFS
jgi:predicted phage terminase large subunit-like protein